MKVIMADDPHKNREVQGGAKAAVAVTELKEKQLFTYDERAPEVRGGGHGQELKDNTLGFERLLVLDRASPGKILFLIQFKCSWQL